MWYLIVSIPDLCNLITIILMILADGLIPFLLHLESYLVFEKGHNSKKDSNEQESIQSSTTPVPGYQMGK